MPQSERKQRVELRVNVPQAGPATHPFVLGQGAPKSALRPALSLAPFQLAASYKPTHPVAPRPRPYWMNKAQAPAEADQRLLQQSSSAVAISTPANSAAPTTGWPTTTSRSSQVVRSPKPIRPKATPLPVPAVGRNTSACRARSLTNSYMPSTALSSLDAMISGGEDSPVVLKPPKRSLSDSYRTSRMPPRSRPPPLRLRPASASPSVSMISNRASTSLTALSPSPTLPDILDVETEESTASLPSKCSASLASIIDEQVDLTLSPVSEFNSLFDGDLSDTPGIEDSRDVSTETTQSAFLLTPPLSADLPLSMESRPGPSIADIETSSSERQKYISEIATEWPESKRIVAREMKVSLMLFTNSQRKLTLRAPQPSVKAPSLYESVKDRMNSGL